MSERKRQGHIDITCAFVKQQIAIDVVAPISFYFKSIQRLPYVRTLHFGWVQLWIFKNKVVIISIGQIFEVIGFDVWIAVWQSTFKVEAYE